MNAVRYLEPLIRFPSVSSVSNEDVSRCVEQQLTSLGFETEWLEYHDAKAVLKVCVSGRLGPDALGGVAYFCHSDVVSAGSWSFPESGPWEPVQLNDRLYGRGSCDMKGSLACMLAAVESLNKPTLKAPLYVVCTADEEVGLRGAREVVANSSLYRRIAELQPRAIIGEPTQLEVVHAHKGGRAYRITSRGTAAHSSSGRGVNANMQMIPFLADIRQLILDTEGRPEWQDDRYQPPTINLNLGINDHTPAMNITPAQSVCTLYFRTMPAIDADQLTNRIYSLAGEHGLEIEEIFATHPLFTDPSRKFVQELLQLTGTGLSRTVAYGTDGACFTELQDIVVLGPGDIRQAHTDDEWIALEQLAKGTALYAEIVRRWCL
ncbi:MAG: M20 family metallopeptidase [Planctomycetaceae bacterium]|nr:M20 family metallopeptidase [Planctomycetaceae bacterium]